MSISETAKQRIYQHIKDNDYFGTTATLIYIARHEIENDPQLCYEILHDLQQEFTFLQHFFCITHRKGQQIE